MSTQLLGFFQHRNRNLRESALKLLIAGLLQGNIVVDPAAAVRSLAPLLADTNQRVLRGALPPPFTHTLSLCSSGVERLMGPL